MMLTREQAASTWCPMVRIARHEETVDLNDKHSAPVTHIVGGCNTDALGGTRVPASCRCIADKCAMWRWGPSDGTHLERRVAESISAGMRLFSDQAVHVPNTPTRGYCGLAGAPVIGGAA